MYVLAKTCNKRLKFAPFCSVGRSLHSRRLAGRCIKRGWVFYIVILLVPSGLEQPFQSLAV